MEQGFYHPERGYWQVTSEPDEEVVSSYPEGTTRVPLMPGAGFQWNGAEWIEMPSEPGPESLIVVPSVTLWERMTEEEANQVEVAMAAQSFRTRQIFMTAQTFRSDHELWPLLASMATSLFGEDRAAQLLANVTP